MWAAASFSMAPGWLIGAVQAAVFLRFSGSLKSKVLASTTTGDLAILLQTLLDGGVFGGKRLLGPMTVKAMLSDQNSHINAPWGMGWRLGNSTGRSLGDLLSPRAFGHNGSPGTVEWADPETQVICIILTNRPLVVDNGLFLRLVSNAVVGSIEK